MHRRQFLKGFFGVSLLALMPAFVWRGARADTASAGTFPFVLSDAEWKKRLTPDQYDILRKQGTEPAFTSPLLNEHRKGIFSCVGCNWQLYSSDTKFDSGTGWPSFWQPISDKAVETSKDTSLFMARNEVHCANCGGHLGHVFDDGPKPTGLRYCMDGVALAFKPDAA